MKLKTNTCRTPQKISITSIIALIAVVTIFSFIATGSGLSLTVIDSHFYLGVARIISAYLGLNEQFPMDKDLLRELINHYAYFIRQWPHLYSLILAALSLFADPYVAGRWLHLTFPAIIGTLLWLIFSRNEGTHTRAFLALSVILLSPTILRLICGVYSDGLFIIWQLSAMLAVSRYLYSKSDTALIMTVIFIALACITRYFGVAMVLALAVTVWRTNCGLTFYRKTALSSLAALLSILPLALYLIFPIISGEAFDIGGRTFGFYLSSLNKLFIFLRNAISSPLLHLTPFWLPKKIQIFFVLYAITAIIILFINQSRKQRQNPPGKAVLQLQYFIKLCLLSYLLLLFIGTPLLDARAGYMGVGPRIFAPLFVWGVVLIALTGQSQGATKAYYSSRFMPLFSASFIAILIAAYLIGSIIFTFKNREIVENTNRYWKNLTALDYVRKEMDGIPWLVSNQPGEVFHYLKIPAFLLPLHFDFIKMEKNFNYLKEMAHLRTLLHKHNGMVLYFNPSFHMAPDVAFQATSLDECLDLLDLKVYFRSESCVVLRP